jgi:hypothetical protein
MPPSTWAIAITVGAIVLLDILFVRFMIRLGWNSLARRFEALAPAPDAVRRNFQSFSFGLFNFGLSVHVAADADHLHLIPAGIVRWAGGRPFSIPWEEIAPLRSGRRVAVVRIAGTTVRGPAWCLSLADPAPSTRAPS